ncbi:MAG: hypothetical protein ACI8PZ_001299 [Myxococcota bacterium]|jgi:hypothetical protein
MRIFGVIGLVACGTVSAPEVAPEAWDGPVAGVASPPGDVVITVDTGIIGGTLPVQLTDAYPFEEVELLLSTAGAGPGPCPPPVGGACLGLLGPVKRLVTMYADIDGNATLALPVPADGDLAGREVCFQAAAVRGPGGVSSDLSEVVCTILDRDDDRDGLSNREELELGTDPLNPDTDGDGRLDGADCAPLDPALDEFCPGDVDAVCGPMLHADPEQVEDGWTLCYVAPYDSEEIRTTQCQDLVTHLPGPVYGCWHGNSEFPHDNDNDMIGNGCRDGVQHTTTYSAWGGLDHILTVCIQD